MYEGSLIADGGNCVDVCPVSTCVACEVMMGRVMNNNDNGRSHLVTVIMIMIR